MDLFLRRKILKNKKRHIIFLRSFTPELACDLKDPFRNILWRFVSIPVQAGLQTALSQKLAITISRFRNSVRIKNECITRMNDAATSYIDRIFQDTAPIRYAMLRLVAPLSTESPMLLEYVEGPSRLPDLQQSRPNHPH